MSLIIFWSKAGSPLSKRNIILSSYDKLNNDIHLFTLGYLTFITEKRLYLKSKSINLIIYPSFNKDYPTEKYSIGGYLQITNFLPEKVFTDIEYNECIAGTLDFHKIFFHQPNMYNNLILYFKKHPRKYNIFIPIYKNYLQRSLYNNISDVFDVSILSKDLRYFTHFNLYEDLTIIPSNKIKIEKIKNIPSKLDNDVPNLWEEILPEYLPKYIDVGDKIVISIPSGINELKEIGIYEIIEINEYDEYLELTLDNNINKKLFKDNAYISHYFDYNYYLGTENLPQLSIKNFAVNSHTGNYRIDSYPIELDIKGTITEKVKIEFFDLNKCKVIFENNQISFGDYDITSQDVEVFNNFIEDNPLWFRLKKDGFIGNFNNGDSIEFEIYGQDYPIWFLRYIPKNTLNKLDKFEDEILIMIK